jgi:hypothetical protein
MTARVHSRDTAAAFDERSAIVLGAVVQLAVVLAGYALTLPFGISPTLVIVLATIPLWSTVMAKFSMLRPIVALTMVAVVAGLYLAELSSTDHEISSLVQRQSIVHIFNGLAILIVVLWARTLFPFHRVAMLYGLGSFADAFLNSPRSFKFDLAVPLTILVVGGLAGLRNRTIPAAVILVIGMYGILDEGRSFFGFCVVAASLTVWQAKPRISGTRVNRWYPALLLAGIAVAIYSIVSSLLTGGYFGPVLQQRSTAQIDATGSLIAGGRPEWSASRALFQHRPRGYGVGVVPELSDRLIAKHGLASIGVDTGGYLDNYMLGGQFRLHSISADLWVNFGWVGLALAATIVYTLVRNLSTLVAANRAPTVVIFICTLALWHMLFGPIYTNWPDVCVALGLSMLPRANVLLSAEDEPVTPERKVSTRRGGHQPAAHLL